MRIVVFASLLQKYGAKAHPIAIAYAVVTVTCSAVAFWLLTGSANVRYFLAAQRQPPNS